MIDVSKKTAFDRYFRSHMNKAPTQIHAWKASLDKETSKFITSLKQKVLKEKKEKAVITAQAVSLAAKKTNKKKKTQKKHTNAYAGVAFGVIGTIAAVSLVAQFKKKVTQSAVEEALI